MKYVVEQREGAYYVHHTSLLSSGYDYPEIIRMISEWLMHNLSLLGGENGFVIEIKRGKGGEEG